MTPSGIKQKIDEVRKAKIQIEVLSEIVEKYSKEIKEHMKKTGEIIIRTDTSEALFISRPAGALDPKKTYEAMNKDLDNFFLVVTVRKGTTNDKFGADYFLGKEDLDKLDNGDNKIDVLRITSLREEAPPRKARA